MNYEYSMDEVKEILKRIKSLNLSAPACFWCCTTEELAARYNGIGPDAWSSKFRRKATELLQWFEPEALIHDWEYTYQPKSYWHFTLANLRFAANGFVAAWQEKSGLAVWRQTGRAILLALLCQIFGYKGFREAKPEMEAQ